MSVSPIGGLCTYVLRRTGIGDYVKGPATHTVTLGLDEACVWLWPGSDTAEERAERIAALQMPWAVMTARARP